MRGKRQRMPVAIFPNPLRNWRLSNVAAFQKYNSLLRFIGFPPRQPLIIDQSGNLDATKI
jgi:hypothetical protein